MRARDVGRSELTHPGRYRTGKLSMWSITADTACRYAVLDRRTWDSSIKPSYVTGSSAFSTGPTLSTLS
jgi:hypothetical protein